METQANWPDARPFITAVVAGIPTGLGLMLVTSMVEIGPHRFWSHFKHPRTDAGSYDLLAASLVGGVAVLLGITAAAFAAGAVVSRSIETKHARLQALVTSRLWFWPSTLLMYTLTALASAAYGFPRYSSAILIEAVLGVAAWVSFVLLNAQAATMVIGPRPSRRRANRRSRPAGSEDHNVADVSGETRTHGPTPAGPPSS